MRNWTRMMLGSFAPLAACGAPAAALTSRPSTSDQKFMIDAAEGGLKEVAMSRLAASQADAAPVRDFGRMVVVDHAAANDRMLTIALQDGLAPPKGLSADDQALYDKLSGLHGKPFDQAYVRAVVDDHQRDIAEYQEEVDHGTDPAVKDAARGTLPMLRHHLEVARGLAATVGK